MTRKFDFVVVGAGIFGASAAYWLRKTGAARVLLIDRGGPASECTGKSAAIVRTFYTIPVMARLAKAAVDLFADMESVLGHSGGFKQTGFVQLMPSEWESTMREKVAMHQALGIRTQILEQPEWNERFPWLNENGVSAIVMEEDSGYADPVRSTQAFVKAFEALGGDTRFQTPCRALLREGDRINGVLLDEGAVEAGVVVNAAGPWSRFLAESVGIELPLRSVREQDTIWEVPPDAAMPSTPVANAVDAVYMRPVRADRWLVGRGFPKEYVEVDPYNYKTSHDPDFIEDVHTRWSRRIPSFAGARFISGYATLYDVTPDWMPFVGPRSGLEGYADACGGSGHAFKTGPIFMKELSAWLLENQVADDFRPMSFDRLAGGKNFQQSFGGNRV